MTRLVAFRYSFCMVESDKTFCARHPRVETGLKCGICGTPICPDCMVQTPVGMKCRDCGRSGSGTLFKVKPGRMALACIIAAAAGAAAGLLGMFGFLVVFISFPYGYFAGSMILKASGMKRGRKLEIAAGVFMAIGGLAVKLIPLLLILLSGVNGATRLGLATLLDPFFWAALGISTACAVSKIRYL